MTRPAPETSTWLAAVTPDQVAADRAAIDETTQPKVGWLGRLKLTEPVRLYLWTVVLVGDLGLGLAGWMTGQWQDYAATAAAVLLGVGGAGEAVRASVYSPAGTITAIRAAVEATR